MLGWERAENTCILVALLCIVHDAKKAFTIHEQLVNSRAPFRVRAGYTGTCPGSRPRRGCSRPFWTRPWRPATPLEPRPSRRRWPAPQVRVAVFIFVDRASALPPPLGSHVATRAHSLPLSAVDVAGPSIPLKAVDRFLALDSPLPAMLLMEQRCSFPEAAADVDETRVLLRACLLNGRLAQGILRVRGLLLSDD